MIPGHITRFTTPKGIELEGIWYGPLKADSVYIIVHGLGSNVFSNRDLFIRLVSETNAVFMFNNRGHDKVTRIRKIDRRKKKGYRSITAGAAHEVFTESIDDIAGAVSVALKQRVSRIFLIGHSTGSQKAVYYLSKNSKSPVKHAILLSPLSDSAGIKAQLSPEELLSVQSAAREFVNSGYPHALLPQPIWPTLDDAQRFLSLSDQHSAEELFPYAYPDLRPNALLKVRSKISVILGTLDEYRDRPISEIADWFSSQIERDNVYSIKGADHSFSHHHKEVIRLITNITNLQS